MIGICPACERKTEIEREQRVEEFKVRGEGIFVTVDLLKCSECGEEFEPSKFEIDPYNMAYREYRKKHGMFQPEDIRAFRDKYGLTQNEFSKLLGFGIATLSRYENGALQDESHDKALRLAMEPKNFLRLVENSPDAFLSHEKRERLIKELKAIQEETNSFEKIYEEHFGNYEPTIFSGFRKLNVDKVFNAILYFCRDGIYKTSLNKNLFYADFENYRRNSISITGLNYVHFQFGPVPENYEYYFATLIHEGAVTVFEDFINGYTGERFVAKNQPDLSLFSDSELKTLLDIKEKLKGMTATQISEFSHKEKGYQETKDHELIPYSYAENLLIG